MGFWKIYDIYYRQVRTFISKMVGDEWLADDLSQETFIKVQENLNDLRDSSKIGPWIFRIARNRCLDYFRSSAARSGNQEESGVARASIDPIVQIQMEQHQMSKCVQDRIHLLPEPLRSVLVLSDTMELSYRETAEILKISVSNVKVRLHRARKVLKETLEEDCTFEHDERSVMVCLPKKMTD